MNEQTIAAISTPPGQGGIGIVRLSGEQARAVADRVFRTKQGHRLTEAAGYTAHYGAVYNGQTRIDEAVALVFAGPRSYTGEDVVELSVHGGDYVLRSVLHAVLRAGAAPAGPGEFTKRAFLNGKLDLIQAESVMQLIASEGRAALRNANAARRGALSGEIAKLRQEMLSLAAAIAAFSDYPEEDLPALEPEPLRHTLEQIGQGLDRLLRGYETGRLLQNGIRTVIVGRPNVGKSTLMNQLVGCERSIVTPIAGTTRDTVEERIMLGELTLHLIDTAGLQETQDPVEAIGVSRAREKLEAADLILAVFDGAQKVTPQDAALLESCKGRPCIVVLNKADLPRRAEESLFKGLPIVILSAKDGTGLDSLQEAIRAVTGTAGLDPASPVLWSERQRDCLARAARAATDARTAAADGFTIDAVGVCLDDALQALFELTGERVTNEVADEVFRQFCVGK